MPNVRYLWLVLGLVVIMLMQSCKQAGCTYSKAYNFNPKAVQEDGSCLYCDSIVRDSINYVFNSYTDYTYGSPHYTETVLYATVIEAEKDYRGNGCILKGLTQGSGNCYNFNYRAILYNRTSSNMILSGQYILSFNSSSMQQPLYCVIPPYGNITIVLGSYCDINPVFNAYFQNITYQYY